MSQVYEIPANDVLARQPGLVAPDYIVRVRLAAFLEAVRRDPELLDEPLGTYDDQFVAQVKQVVARPKRPLPIFAGYPMTPEMFPGIGITLRPATQTDRGIGNVVGEMPYPTGLVEILGSLWDASVSIMCFGTSQEEANYLGMIVAWMLQVLGEDLESVDGLGEQNISLTDPKPVEDDVLKGIQNVFSRVVTFQCKYLNTWARRYSPLLRDVTGGADDDRAYP